MAALDPSPDVAALDPSPDVAALDQSPDVAALDSSPDVALSELFLLTLSKTKSIWAFTNPLIPIFAPIFILVEAIFESPKFFEISPLCSTS